MQDTLLGSKRRLFGIVVSERDTNIFLGALVALPTPHLKTTESSEETSSQFFKISGLSLLAHTRTRGASTSSLTRLALGTRSLGGHPLKMCKEPSVAQLIMPVLMASRSLILKASLSYWVSPDLALMSKFNSFVG